MPGAKCPYCGTVISSALKFCVNCQRPLSDEFLKQLGFSSACRGREDLEEGQGYMLSKRSYSILRKIRTFFFLSSILLTLVLVYFCTMKFVIHGSVFGEAELAKFLPCFKAGH